MTMEQQPLADLIFAGAALKQDDEMTFLDQVEDGKFAGCALGGALIAANLASDFLQQRINSPRWGTLVCDLLGIEDRHERAISDMYIDSHDLRLILSYCRRHNIMANCR